MASDTRKESLSATATAINSVRLNCTIPAHVRIYVREVEYDSFSVDGLQVEFIPVPPSLQRAGNVPAHVHAEATFDRIAGARMSTDWDSALILDFDQLAISDITNLFRFDLSECLAAGRLWNKCLDDAVVEWFGRSLPEQWKYVAQYRFFYMGPMLNLAAIRDVNAFTLFDDFHADGGMEEQIALHVALRDRIKPLPSIYNVIPQWDGISSDAAILHFTGPSKPWNNPDLQGAKFWQRYATSMETLSRGQYSGLQSRKHYVNRNAKVPGWQNVWGILPLDLLDPEASVFENNQGIKTDNCLFGNATNKLKTVEQVDILHIQACLPRQIIGTYQELFPHPCNTITFLDPFELGNFESLETVFDDDDGFSRVEGDILLCLASLFIEGKLFDLIYVDVEIEEFDVPLFANLLERIAKRDSVLVVHRPLFGSLSSNDLIDIKKFLARHFSDVSSRDPALFRKNS